MDLTDSYTRVFSDDVQLRYGFAEVRNAAAVLAASDLDAGQEITDVLSEFAIYDDDILIPGGNRGRIPIRLDTLFAYRDWVPVRVNTEIKLVGKVKLGQSKRSREGPTILESTVESQGFEVDNFKRRVALDVEWNAKDGNLDRDLSAYRALYDYGLIDVAVMITRDHESITYLAGELNSEDAARRLGTQTTTNIRNLVARLTRGDAGGCPVLAIALGYDTWAGHGEVAPRLDVPATVDTAGD